MGFSFIFSIIIAYLLGSISCAILVARYLQLPDPRTQGSSNPGATNLLRLGGKKAGLLTLGGDALKGIIAVIIGKVLGIQGAALGLIALAVVVGHIFPLYYNFKGGKGVATALGTFLALSFWVGILTLIVWGTVVFIFRYASLASLAAVVAAPILMLIGGPASIAFPLLLITILIMWKHKENIERLKKGTEPKIKW